VRAGERDHQAEDEDAQETGSTALAQYIFGHELPIGPVLTALEPPCTLLDGGQKYRTAGALRQPLTGG
jgi:hypothetical protein